MTDETKQEIKEKGFELIEWVRSGVEAGADFVMEQAPLLAQEIVTYGRATHTIYFCVCVLIIVFGLLSIKHNIWKTTSNDEREYVPAFVICFMSAILMIICSFEAVDNFNPMIKSWTAPRLYTIEYVADLYKEKKK